MAKTASVARTVPFAHLLGFGKKPAASAPAASAARIEGGDDKDKDEEERKKRDGESDEDYAKRMDALDAKKAKAAKAESDKDEPGDDDKEKAKAAAMTERARCAAIIAHGINCGAVRQACVYAFDTDLASDAAVATIDATVLDREANAPSATSGLASRMALEATPHVRHDGGESGPTEGAPAVIAMALAAMDKARGKTA